MDRELRKREYLKSFIAAFAENGIDKTSIKKLANAAKINEASIYQYFKNKDEIIVNCVQYFFHIVQREVCPILLNTDQDIECRLQDAFRFLNSVSQQGKFIIQVLTSPVYSKMCEPSVQDFLHGFDPVSHQLSEEFSISRERSFSLLYLLLSLSLSDKILNDRETLARQFDFLVHEFQREEVPG